VDPEIPLCHAELVSASIISSRMWILKQVQEDRGKLKGMDPEINLPCRQTGSGGQERRKNGS